ncbi:hypothetical protein H920_01018 [Fukomys damarensis]|uniref:Uncharacterized protein n=1 Tax=Fukomys damarensis TaxID=885580 RepID=A0A091E487_FUKDA|nr:hypothetical protein H920_01018 [Fukomys damarensis]
MLIVQSTLSFLQNKAEERFNAKESRFSHRRRSAALRQNTERVRRTQKDLHSARQEHSCGSGALSSEGLVARQTPPISSKDSRLQSAAVGVEAVKSDGIAPNRGSSSVREHRDWQLTREHVCPPQTVLQQQKENQTEGMKAMRTCAGKRKHVKFSE